MRAEVRCAWDLEIGHACRVGRESQRWVVLAWWMSWRVMDDGVGQGDEGVDDLDAPFSADGEFAKAAVVPGVCTLDHPASAGLEVRGLSVVYPGARGSAPLTVVDDVDLTLDRGEVAAILGASGSGKSSLLRTVAGLEEDAAGTLSWDGEDVIRVPVHERGFGLMFQEGQLFPFRDVAGNVAYGLAGWPRAAPRVRRGGPQDRRPARLRPPRRGHSLWRSGAARGAGPAASAPPARRAPFRPGPGPA